MCTVVLWVCAVVSVMLPVMLRVNLVVVLTDAVAWVDVEVHKAHTEADTPPKKDFKAPSIASRCVSSSNNPITIVLLRCGGGYLEEVSGIT